jgi:hypothetical protein
VGCINVREGEGRVIIYQLDGCGNPDEGAANKLVLETVSEFTWEDTIEDGDEVTERNFGGQKIYSDTGADEISNIAVSLTSAGINPSLDSLLMGAATKTDGGDVVGYGRLDLSSSTGVAVEILIELDADACAPGASAAPIAGWFFPLVKNWKPTGGGTLNGSDLVKPQYSGKAYKNANVFEGSPTDVDFSKWDTIHDPTTNGQDGEWYTFYLFDGSTYSLPAADCEPVTFT